MSVSQAARAARILEIMPTVVISAVSHHVALKEKNEEAAELWKPLYYRNSSLGL